MTAPCPDTPEAPGGLLAPEPTVRTGALIGYARVSTSGQLLDRQQHALAEAGCPCIFADKGSDKDADRPELAAYLNYLGPGDTLVVPSLDRLSRPLADLIAIVGTLRRAGVGSRACTRAGHHHPRRPTGLPRLRRAGGVHPRADRRGHPRGPSLASREAAMPEGRI